MTALNMSPPHSYSHYTSPTVYPSQDCIASVPVMAYSELTCSRSQTHTPSLQRDQAHCMRIHLEGSHLGATSWLKV